MLLIPPMISWIKGYEKRRQVNSCQMKRNEVLYKEPDHGQTFVSASLKIGEKGEDGTESGHLWFCFDIKEFKEKET